jgi:N-acetylglucosaminyl-diphospho-decaprenol L-rhamnosyltransferase
MPRAHIVIVNWNSGDWLRRCVDSIRQHGEGHVDRVVVVDNGSTDGSDRIEPAPWLEIIHAGKNLGFAAGSNLGAQGATAPYILCLNPDAALHPGTLAKAIAFMERPEARQVGICGIRLVDETGQVQPHTVSFPTPATIYTLRTMGNGIDHSRSQPVDHVIGAFYLIRRSLFEELGGFDESFFLYLEDVDLSLRARQAGWSVHYLAEAVAFHKGGGTSEQIKASRLFYSLRSRLVYARKHFAGAGYLRVLATTLLVEPFLRLGRAGLRLSWREAADTLRAYRGLLAYLRDTRGANG